LKGREKGRDMQGCNSTGGKAGAFKKGGHISFTGQINVQKYTLYEGGKGCKTEPLRKGDRKRKGHRYVSRIRKRDRKGKTRSKKSGRGGANSSLGDILPLKKRAAKKERVQGGGLETARKDTQND